MIKKNMDLCRKSAIQILRTNSCKDIMCSECCFNPIDGGGCRKVALSSGYDYRRAYIDYLLRCGIFSSREDLFLELL